ncbi:MAG: efflux RND transporter periplasmic adaptor subunit, partial [Oxalobacteraceae bacterium]|nr:efflux RND transporter periplasmic adaptor subunit [Oxalobacteraceae bacterium]
MSTRFSTQTPLTCREAHQTRSHLPVGIQTRIIAGALGLIALLGIESSAAQNQIPLTQTVTASSSPSLGPGTQLEAVVEAVRSTTLSSQVAGSIVSLTVKAGDRVKAGQELLRIDARAAQQQVQSASAQLESARAALIVAVRELERQRQLFVKQYISQGALDRAQGQWEMAQAQVQALEAQAIAAKTQSGFFVLEAPYSGVISDV